MNKNSLVSQTEKLVKSIEPTFKKLPHLPKGVIKVLVAVIPWLAVIGGVLGVLSGISALFGTTGMYGFMYRWGISPFYLQLTSLTTIISSVLAIVAFKHLKEEKYLGWLYLFWIMLINVFTNLVGLLFYPASIVGFLIGLAIQLYLLFEIKAWYK